MANEKRLIDANAFLKALNERPTDFLDIGGDFGFFDETIDSIVNEQPTVEVIEVIYGQWLTTNDKNKKRCSRCDVIHLIAQYPHGQANYCPNCGAKMDGEETKSSGISQRTVQALERMGQKVHGGEEEDRL